MMSYEIEKKGVVDKFKAWLSEQGAEILAPTNPYELVRFRAQSAVHVIYTGRRGISAGRFAEQCFAAFRKKKPLDMGITKKARTNSAKRKAALVLRDGRGCFFCIRLMSETDMTEEHLVAIGKGGTNHLDNMVLAHERCNKDAGGLPLIEKIKIREKIIIQRERLRSEVGL